MFVDNDILPMHPSKFLDDEFVPFSVMSGYSRDDGYLFALEKIPTLRRSGMIFKLHGSDMNEMIDFNMINHNSERSDLVKDVIYNRYYNYETSWRNWAGQIELRVGIVNMITDEGFYSAFGKNADLGRLILKMYEEKLFFSPNSLFLA